MMMSAGKLLKLIGTVTAVAILVGAYMLAGLPALVLAALRVARLFDLLRGASKLEQRTQPKRFIFH
jgi:hypothetical protein